MAKRTAAAAAVKLTGLIWWIPQWRQSSAFMQMTLAEQGGYRNMLDEAFLRGGVLPDDERILARACGDELLWPDIRDRVLRWFTLTGDGWRNDTLDQVIYQAQRRARNQRAYRARLTDNGAGHRRGNGAATKR